MNERPHSNDRPTAQGGRTLTGAACRARAAMQVGLKSRDPDHRGTRIHELKARVGEPAMAIELLERRIDTLEAGVRPLQRRPLPSHDS
ncbi:MAG: hypothetical protein KF817_13510 [Phycisphaeraceae bacterium]|nr:hypothetical protein [Phycisphaeraceae bacterium]